MKIEIQKPGHPSELQQLVSRLPFDPASEAEFQGLMFVEQLLGLMKEKGINRTQLAKEMGVGPSRVTAMLNGTSNFKMETLVRAADAVGASISTALVPKGAKAHWQVYREDESPSRKRIRKRSTAC